MRFHASRRSAALVLVAALPIAAVSLGTGNAGAITGAPDAPETLPAVASSMWQTNNSVWALAYSQGIVFAAGDFTALRAPGSGSDSVSMGRVAAFDAATGRPCVAPTPCVRNGRPFTWANPGLSARVWALTVTPDGSKLYAGGDFGGPRKKVAGWDLTKSTPTLFPYNPQIKGQVRALASTNTALYAGGAFSSVGGVPRSRVAAFTINGSGGAFRSTWTPDVDGNVYALMVGPRPGSVVLGGKFRKVNGAAHSGIAQVDEATGDVNGPMSNTIIPGQVGNTRSDVKTLTTDGTSIFLGAEGSGYGIFDGQASVNPSTGELNWKTNCLGATQALAVVGGSLYVGSHSHDCSRLPTGGFGQTPFANDSSSWHHLLAEQKDGDANSGGGQLRTWYPVTNAGPTNGASPDEIGPRAMATDGTQLWVGGQFTTVNGATQRGLARFAPGGNGARPTRPASLTGTSAAPGQVTLRWTGSSDPDDRYLTYKILRDNQVIDEVGPVDSPWWQSPSYVWRDDSAPNGRHKYAARAYDASGLRYGRNITFSTAGAPTGGYRASVLADSPSFYWRLDETGGGTAADSSGNNAPGAYRSGISLGRDGAIRGNGAVGLNRTTANLSPTAAPAPPPSDYSLELWFRTEPGQTNGGRMIGWSNNATGTSSTPDRAVYMLNSGQINYSIFTRNGSTCRPGNRYMVGGTCYLWSPQSYNDGSWHHLVATQSSTSGMALYVDGTRVASTSDSKSYLPKATGNGVWRVGVDTLSGFPNQPFSPGLNGEVDEVAVYPTVLTPAQVAAHFGAAE